MFYEGGKRLHANIVHATGVVENGGGENPEDPEEENPPEDSDKENPSNNPNKPNLPKNPDDGKTDKLQGSCSSNTNAAKTEDNTPLFVWGCCWLLQKCFASCTSKKRKLGTGIKQNIL